MKKIFYVDKEELNLFINSSEIIKEGYGYEWENEDVIHLHINPVNECPHVTKLAKFKLPNCPTGMFWNTLCRI